MLSKNNNCQKERQRGMRIRRRKFEPTTEGATRREQTPATGRSAEGRNRTGTRFPSQDFKSCASTNSATPAFSTDWEELPNA